MTRSIEDFTTRSTEEATTRLLFADYLDNRAHWSSEGPAIAMAFRALYTASLSVERITKVAEALSGVLMTPEMVQAELTQMVRAKVLRTRTQRGIKLYEVRY